ncbi:CRIB domain-containing protein RIC4-like [Malania oleifera]|uniref:CRIB domain-containing protein RIC4-like n=1 Tax=Malania oleifera TaxID=397392 RepID=UPI0025AE3D26|nr:CRIB domain-containing protein RIC4-like [Malania oleifera]
MKEMKDRMERFVVLPFAGGCVSHSSVAVVEKQPRRSKPDTNTYTLAGEGIQEDEKNSSSVTTMKNSMWLPALPRSNISNGFQRFFKGFRGFSHLFVYEEEMEEVEMDVEIGFPTDVKHVTHIGWDNTAAATDSIKGWDTLMAPHLFSLPPA